MSGSSRQGGATGHPATCSIRAMTCHTRPRVAGVWRSALVVAVVAVAASAACAADEPDAPADPESAAFLDGYLEDARAAGPARSRTQSWRRRSADGDATDAADLGPGAGGR